MIISIDTNKDSIEEIKKVIAFLKNIVEKNENSGSSNSFGEDTTAVTDFFGSDFNNNREDNNDSKNNESKKSNEQEIDFENLEFY